MRFWEIKNPKMGNEKSLEKLIGEGMMIILFKYSLSCIDLRRGERDKMEERVREWKEQYPGFKILPEYIAGFADGDGSICLVPLKNKDGEAYSYQCMSHFAQSYPLFCVLLQQEIGGSIYGNQRQRDGVRRCEYMLRMTGKSSIPFLQMMKEHSIAKMKQAELAEEFLTKYHNKIKDNLDNVKTIAETIKELNKTCPIPMERMNRINWIYIAGLFDAEGCVICDVKKKKRYNLYITQKNHMDLLEKIIEFMGYGSIRPKDYRIVISTIPKILDFIEKVLPYTIVKRKQLDAMNQYLQKRSQMKQSDPNYNKITEEDQALLDIIHTEKHENISMNEIKDFIKEKNTKEQKSITKLIKTELVPRAIDLLPDRSTKNKVSKRKTNFEESKQLILKALEQKSMTEIIDEWNDSHESKINERQLLNLWSGKTELLPFEFNENSEWTYQDYCEFIKELPEKRKTIERS